MIGKMVLVIIAQAAGGGCMHSPWNRVLLLVK